MEQLPQVIAAIAALVAILGVFAGVIYKFASHEGRISHLDIQLKDISDSVRGHINDKSVHHDSRLFDEFREYNDRRFNEQKDEMRSISQKLDMLLFKNKE